jgi:hypothetical protein
MIERNGGDHRDSAARGEINRLLHYQRRRKQLISMCSLNQNESLRSEVD